MNVVILIKLQVLVVDGVYVQLVLVYISWIIDLLFIILFQVVVDLYDYVGRYGQIMKNY